MKAKVTTQFAGRPDNEALSRTILVGEIITGDLAAVAIRDGLADAEIAEPSATEPVDPLASLTTVNALKAFADEHKIDIGDASKKDDIRAAIHLALESRQ